MSTYSILNEDRFVGEMYLDRIKFYVAAKYLVGILMMKTLAVPALKYDIIRQWFKK